MRSGDRRRDRARRVRPRDGRSRAYVDGRLATVGRARRGRARARRPARPARAPVAARARGAARRARPLRRRAGARRAGRATATARAELRAIDAELAGARRRRPRPGPRDRPARASRSRRSTPPGSTIPTRTTRSTPRRTLLADAVAHREALARRATRRSTGAALDARRATRWPRSTAGRRSPALDGAAARRCRPSWPTSSRSCATRSSGSTRTPSGSTTVRGRRQLLRELGRKYGDTLADVIALRRRGRRPGWPSSSGTRSGRPRSRPRGREHAAAAQAAADALTRRPPGGAPSRWPRAVEAHLRELAMPARGRRGRGRAGRSRPTTVTTA